MSKVLINMSNLENIADAIRSKNGESTRYKPGEMAAAIAAIPTGSAAVIESKSITANGTYTAPTGVDGYSPVVVDVQPNLQSKTATENGTYTPDDGVDGFSSVEVNVSGGIIRCSPVGYFGDYAGESTTSLTCAVSGLTGEKVVLVVMHRAAITTPPGMTLVYSSSGGWQFISVFEKIMEASSESYTVSAGSSGRMCACAFLFDANTSISSTPVVQMMDGTDTSSSHVFTIAPATAYRLAVFSLGYAGASDTSIVGGGVLNPVILGNMGDQIRMGAAVLLDLKDVVYTWGASVQGSDDYNNSRLFLFDLN